MKNILKKIGGLCLGLAMLSGITAQYISTSFDNNAEIQVRADEGTQHEISSFTGKGAGVVINNQAAPATIELANQGYMIKQVIIGWKHNKSNDGVTANVTIGGISLGTGKVGGSNGTFTTTIGDGASKLSGAIKIAFTNTMTGTGKGTLYLNSLVLVETVSSTKKVQSIAISGPSSISIAETNYKYYSESLPTATVTYDDSTTSTTALVWSLASTTIASIDQGDGTIKFLGEGTCVATVTSTDDNNFSASVTYNVGSLLGSTQETAMTVAQARSAIDASCTGSDVYVKGIVSNVEQYLSTYKSITYSISDDGTTSSNQFKVYSGKGLNGADFASINDVKVGDFNIIKGEIKLFQSDYEFDKNNYIVYKEAGKTVSSVVISGNIQKTSYEEGETLNPAGLIVTVYYSDSSSEVIETGISWSFNPATLSVGNTSCDVTATVSDVSSSAYTVDNLTVTGYVASSYTKVTEAPVDWRGTYLLVYESESNAYIFNSSLDTLDATSNYVTGTITNNTITSTQAIDSVAVSFVREVYEGVDSCYVKCANGKYLTASKGGINCQNTATANNIATFSTNADSLIINDFILRFNATSGQTRFRFYAATSTTMSSVALYKLVNTQKENDEATSYCSSFYTTVSNTCDPTGQSDNITSTIWNAQKVAFKALSPDAQAIIAGSSSSATGSVLNAINLYDYIVAKYTPKVHADFMSRTANGLLVVASSPNINNLFNSSSASTWIIVAVSLAGLTAIGGYFFYKKRKENF